MSFNDKEVRRMRLKISEEFGHDLSKFCQHCRELEKELRKSGKYKFAAPEPPVEKYHPTESVRGEVAD